MEIENEKWSKNIDIKQVLDGLVSYPNEFWKYPVVIYYLRYHDDYDFEENFLTFLRKLLAVLAARYIITPTINAVKRGILNLDAEIIKSSSPKFDFNYVEENELKEKIKSAHRNTVRMILKMLAYQHQEELLPEKWEIEHILPQKWQSAYFVKYSDQEVKDLVEHIGNKIPFEKKLNIIASNGYFAKKQLSYKQSKVKILQDLSESHTDWGLDEIRERDIRISDELFSLLLSWGVNTVASSIDNKC
nr:HNH endonuclease family protein [Levilactobacillus brevis]